MSLLCTILHALDTNTRELIHNSGIKRLDIRIYAFPHAEYMRSFIWRERQPLSCAGIYLPTVNKVLSQKGREKHWARLYVLYHIVHGTKALHGTAYRNCIVVTRPLNGLKGFSEMAGQGPKNTITTRYGNKGERGGGEWSYQMETIYACMQRC